MIICRRWESKLQTLRLLHFCFYTECRPPFSEVFNALQLNEGKLAAFPRKLTQRFEGNESTEEIQQLQLRNVDRHLCHRKSAAKQTHFTAIWKFYIRKFFRNFYSHSLKYEPRSKERHSSIWRKLSQEMRKKRFSNTTKTSIDHYHKNNNNYNKFLALL